MKASTLCRCFNIQVEHLKNVFCRKKVLGFNITIVCTLSVSGGLNLSPQSIDRLCPKKPDDAHKDLFWNATKTRKD